MKTSLALVAVIGLTLTPIVNAQTSDEQLLGAIAGAALGSTIGDGDGRKAAMVVGAILGYRNGERLLNGGERRQFISMDANDFHYYCRNRIPYRYSQERNTYNMWMRGCMNRLRQQQREFEREAYEDGYYGSSN